MIKLTSKRKAFELMLGIVGENLQVNGYQSLQAGLSSLYHELSKELETPSEFTLKRSELEITIRSCNCLSSVGVFTDKDLMAWNPSYTDLRKISGLGSKSFKEIREYIKSIKLENKDN